MAEEPTSGGGVARRDIDHAETAQLARVARLSSFGTPTLEGVEQRRLQLWILSLALLVTVALALAFYVSGGGIIKPPWLPKRAFETGLLLLVGLFSWYAIDKELQLRRIAQLLIAERVLTASLTQRLGEVTALLDASRAVNLDLELQDVLARIARCALELLEGRDASVMLAHGERELRTVAASGHSAARGARVRFGEGIAGKVATTREAVLVSGVVRRPDLPTEVSALVPESPESAMSVPLVHRGELLGVLNVNARPQRSYTEHDLRALSIFGEQAAAAIANAKLLEDQRLAATKTLFHALHDSLTGLPNRGLFLDRLEQAVRRRGAGRPQAAVMLLDLDDFKRVNDSLGHEAGDRVLLTFGERVRQRLRQGDTVARFGGDEFAVLVEGVGSEEDVLSAARRITSAVIEPFPIGERRVQLQASVGIAMPSGETPSPHDLLRRADLALGAAKQRGRGQIVVFEEALHAAAVGRLELESDLVVALDRRELEVYYQPIVRLLDGETIGLEALVRWHHPSRGLLSAATFVPVAAAAGLLPEIDRWVLAEVCRAAAAMPGALPFYVNLGVQRLREPSIVDDVSAALTAAGLPAERLVLEIAESARLEELSEAAARLHDLKNLGVRLALDDFGSGYASLGSLQRLAVDLVKIDRAFVEGLSRDGGERALVRAILRLARALELEAVAEGIELEEQRHALLELGCDLGQGYLLGEPMPLSAVRQRLNAS